MEQDVLEIIEERQFNLSDFALFLSYLYRTMRNGKNEVKFRKSNKTFVTFYVHESYFTLLLIYGKKERAVLEEQINKFPEYLQDYYRNSKTYHDGKWMFIDIHDETYIDSLIKMMYIKKKPNRKKENLANVILGKCGNRCDQCQLYRM